MKAKVGFKTALSLLLKGEVVALPTETVYGLAGRIDRSKTLKKIFSLKKRPFSNPLIVHCYNTKQALEHLSTENPLVKHLFNFFSPGPLTLVANKNEKVSPLITANKKTVALRIPQHPLMRRILKELPVPLAAPSANIYGTVSPVSARHVLSFFNKTVPVLEGGVCKKGLESTIVLPDTYKKKLFILRPGIITQEDLETFVKRKNLGFVVETKQDFFQPGGQKSHYKPKIPLYIIETQKTKKEIEKFLSKKFPNQKLTRLCLQTSPKKTAYSLYSQLIKLSNKKADLIFVQKTRKHTGGLWETVWNRLNKASFGFYRL